MAIAPEIAHITIVKTRTCMALREPINNGKLVALRVRAYSPTDREIPGI
jgi:hypothetical protein